MDILSFDLDSRRYGFMADSVIQVVQMVAISPLPGAPGIVEGVVNVRGAVVPVFDLRARFGFPPRPIDPTQHLIILAAGDRTAAVRVDAADDLVTIPDAEITRPPELADAGVGTDQTRLLAGVAATADGTTIIYDLSAFLSASESTTLDGALAPPGG